MSTQPPHTAEPVPPKAEPVLAAEESRLANELGRNLAARLAGRRDLQVQILYGQRPVGEPLSLPDAALRLLNLILEDIDKGIAVTLAPTHAELTTEEAADFLNVSPPFLTRLLDEGRIPFRQAGSQRRVPFKELMDYKKKSDAECRQALDELVELSQELNLY